MNENLWQNKKDAAHFKETGRIFYYAGELKADPSEPAALAVVVDDDDGENNPEESCKVPKDYPHGWRRDYGLIEDYIKLDEEAYFQAARQAMREGGNRRYNAWTNEMRVLANQRVSALYALTYGLTAAEVELIKEDQLKTPNRKAGNQ